MLLDLKNRYLFALNLVEWLAIVVGEKKHFLLKP